MNKHSITLILLFCFPLVAFAQRIRVINSTEQKWYGGVAGKSGANYTFHIEFSGFKTEPIADTIWIGQQPIAIKLVNGTEYANTKITRTMKAITFVINARTSKDDYAGHYPSQGHETKIIVHAPIPYKGVALLSYKLKENHQYFEVKKIMNKYPAANYP